MALLTRLIERSKYVGFLLCIGWTEAFQHGVMLGVEGLQPRLLTKSSSVIRRVFPASMQKPVNRQSAV